MSLTSAGSVRGGAKVQGEQVPGGTFRSPAFRCPAHAKPPADELLTRPRPTTGKGQDHQGQELDLSAPRRGRRGRPRSTLAPHRPHTSLFM